MRYSSQYVRHPARPSRVCRRGQSWIALIASPETHWDSRGGSRTATPDGATSMLHPCLEHAMPRIFASCSAPNV